MTTDVILVTHDNPHIEATLQNILRIREVNRVLVFSDAATAETAELIEEERGVDSRIEVFKSPYRIGTGAALNFLIARSSADFILVHGDHDFSEEIRVVVLEQEAEKNPDIVLWTHELKANEAVPRNPVAWGDYTVTRQSLEGRFPLRYNAAFFRRAPIVDANITYPQGIMRNHDVIFAQRVLAEFPFQVNHLNRELGRQTTGIPEEPLSPWLAPQRFYLHHAGVAVLHARSTRAERIVTPLKWPERLGRELTSAYARATMGYEVRASDAVLAPMDPWPGKETLHEVPQGDCEPEEAPGRQDADGAIVYIGWNAKECQDFVRSWAESLGRPYEFVSVDTDFFKVAGDLKRAAFVVIWNGAQDNGRNAKALCEAMKIPYAFFEWGVAPQATTFLVDLDGFAGDSMLTHPLGWVGDADLKAYREGVTELRTKYPLEPKKARVLVPLQIENDSQILYHCPYRNMGEFVEHVAAMYPSHDIIVRPHPKSGSQRPWKSARATIEGKDVVKDFYEAARISEVVVGINSTSLVEAAMIGVPVVALGKCPLHVQPLRHRERLLAGYWALRVLRTQSIGDVLQRFNLKPID
jgi:hypothetical protein